MIEDAELLRRYAEERREDAFAELVQRHLGFVHAVALRQVGGDAHLAQDVAQRVFSELARRAGSLCRHPVLSGWLYRTAQFTAGKAMRSERRRRHREQEAHIMHELTAESEEIDPVRLRPVLDTAMATLSERDRDAIMLRFFEGQAFAQIGAKLRLTEDAARMRVERALDRLRSALHRRGVISTEAALGIALASQAAQAAPAGLASAITGSALAGVGASGSVAALFAFMSTTKSTVRLAAAVIALGFGVKYVGGISATARASLAEERKITYQLALRADRAAAEVKTARSQAVARTTVGGGPSSSEVSAVEDEGRGPFGPNPPGSRARGRALLAAYPELREMLIELRRQSFRSRYSGLYEQLELSGEQGRAFEDIMMSGVSYGILGDPSTSVIMEPYPRLPDAEKNARLRELLGAAGFQRFKEYQDSPRDIRPAQVASALYYTETPLTAGQGEQLTQLFTEANRLGRGKKEFVVEEYWAPVLAHAATFLSPPQMAALEGVKAHDVFNFSRSTQPIATAAASSTP